MKTIIVASLLAVGLLDAQPGPPYPVTATRITRGAGAPSAGCSVTADRGKVYVRSDAAAASSSLYVCANTTGSTTAWELAGGSGGSGNVSASGTFVVGNLYKASATDGKTAVDAGIVAANVLTGTALTGIGKFTSGVGAAAVAADIIGLMGGTCNSTTVVGGDGNCQSQSGYVLGKANLTTTGAIPIQNGTIGTLTQQTGLTFSGNILSVPGIINSGTTGSSGGLSIYNATPAMRLLVGFLAGVGGLYPGANSVLAWSSGNDPSSGQDTNLSRDAAGVIDFGTGAAGSVAGSWKATNGTLSGTLTIPTLQPTTSYKSVDGTTGATVTTCTGFKNGLCISGT